MIQKLKNLNKFDVSINFSGKIFGYADTFQRLPVLLIVFPEEHLKWIDDGWFKHRNLAAASKIDRLLNCKMRNHAILSKRNRLNA